ncbi:hypothetical protein JCM19240_3667 [Vibrio maritimus]|uniref:Uncharacterized protein n=1 Tax=Vibrio maritimus TaxID=990268 RepID=A0A090TWI6_9VIBR|nr:hypothetical protein JCM19240_3667 [Vibrio maritimus]
MYALVKMAACFGWCIRICIKKGNHSYENAAIMINSIARQ